ncbi:MAG: hypothetical protein N4A35_06500 [Flavobacteriales bacterium]|jgi:thioredoxin-related protein|nr:hypothetical protein [Flavobacteriales bacterium]
MPKKIEIEQILILVISFILLVSGLGKLFGEGKLLGGIAAFDLRMIEDGFGNWMSTPIFNRIFVALEINVGILMLTKWVKRSWLYYMLVALTILYVIDVILGWNNRLSIDNNLLFLFNRFLTLTTLPFLIISLFLLKKKKNNYNSWLSLVVIVPFVALPFIINPIFIEDMESKSIQYEAVDENWEIIASKFQEKAININEGAYLIAFFSTNCKHCNELAQVIGVSKRGFKSSRKILMVFPGNEEDTQAFIQRNKADFDYIRVTPDQFTKAAGFSFPSLFSLKNGKVVKHWTGNNFSFKVRDEEI